MMICSNTDCYYHQLKNYKVSEGICDHSKPHECRNRHMPCIMNKQTARCVDEFEYRMKKVIKEYTEKPMDIRK